MPAQIEALTINRWRLEWLVAVERGGDDLAARAMADEVVAKLPQRLGALSISVPGDDQDAIVFIDRLTFDGDVGAAWDRDLVAEHLARSLGHDLGRRLAAAVHGDGVVIYRDRPEYVARYLVDRLAGAADSWRYASFEGLRALPASAAARTLAEAEPAVFLEALRRLGDGALATVARAISEGDARRILACYRLAGAPPMDLDALETVWAAVEAWPELRVAGASAAEALQLLGRCARARPDVAAGALVEAIVSLGALITWVTGGVGLAGAPAPASGDGGRWSFAAGQNPARWQVLVDRITVVAARSDVRRSRASAAAATSLGGALMLLGLLDDAGVRFDELPPLGDARGGDVYRLLLVACAHGQAWTAVFEDACLRDLLAIPPPLELRAAHDWLAGVADGDQERAAALSLADVAADLDEREVPAGAPEADDFPGAASTILRAGAATLLRAFAARLPGFSTSSPRFLRERFLACAATVERFEDDADRVARLQPVQLELVLRMTRLKALAFPTGGNSGRVFLREAT